MTDIDTNVDNYTYDELMDIIGASDYDEEEIREKSEKLIKQFETSNPDLSNFFGEIQLVLVQYVAELNKDKPYTNKQTDLWYRNQNLKQDNKVQADKATDRKNKIDVYNNPHLPMKQETLGVNNNFQVEVAQDSLNPNLKNTFNRFVNIDSQFRQSNNIDSATDFSLDLSDTLFKALSIRLFCFQIPFTWYVIDEVYGNNFFWITNGTENIPIVVPGGNYSSNEFGTALNKVFASAGFTFPLTTPINTPVSFNAANGKITLQLYGGIFNGATFQGITYGAFTISETTLITFFDYTCVLRNTLLSTCLTTNYINQTLGWVMGFRQPFVNVMQPGNIGSAVLDLNGTKYLILVVDDYNQNHVNNGLVSITEYSKTLKMPSYYSPDLPYVCIEPDGVSDNINSLQTANGLEIADKLEIDYVARQVILPSAPRTLTQSQIYTINQIIKNKSNNTNFRSRAPTSTDILAILPVKTSSLSTGSMITEMSGSLQDNVRQYFGPVNIERMKIKLLDDKGNVIDLNGADWSFTLICECLYQY